MHTTHYTPHQGSMAQRHPLGEIVLAGLKYVADLVAHREDRAIDRRVIEKGQPYPPSHFNGFDGHVLFPAKSYHPREVHRYDYKILGTLYNVYTENSSDEKQKVNEIWDRTKNMQIDDLEILVKRHNHMH